jgi:hypothetical protein
MEERALKEILVRLAQPEQPEQPEQLDYRVTDIQPYQQHL